MNNFAMRTSKRTQESSLKYSPQSQTMVSLPFRLCLPLLLRNLTCTPRCQHLTSILSPVHQSSKYTFFSARNSNFYLFLTAMGVQSSNSAPSLTLHQYFRDNGSSLSEEKNHTNTQTEELPSTCHLNVLSVQVRVSLQSTST